MLDVARIALLALLTVAPPVAASAAAKLADAPCYECHDELQEAFAVGIPHAPVEEGDCAACHEDHGDEETLKLSSPVPKLCFDCHDEFTKSTVHDPVGEGECLGCHNPHHSAQKALLTQAVPALCNDCHDDYTKGASVHEPVGDGACADCHDPHQADQKFLLTKAVPALCSDCHDDLAKGASVHEPVAEGSCTDCHEPHHAGQKTLLKLAVPALCRECHDDYSKGTSVHDPVAEGGCTDCHKPHSSEFAPLLTARYDRSLRVVFSPEAYALCLTCHELESFTDAVTENATRFRYGARNLHYVHLINEAEDKGYGLAKKRRKPAVSCGGCHLPHSAEQQRLIRPERDRGKMTVFTISFRATKGGGGCVVGCHKPLQYVRDAATGGARPAELSTPQGQVR